MFQHERIGAHQKPTDFGKCQEHPDPSRVNEYYDKVR